jgi:hypothetical protein
VQAQTGAGNESRLLFVEPFYHVEIDHFYQDRLGINTGQAETNARFSAGARGFLPVRDV